MDIEDLIKIRRHLHKNPELSGQEKKTSEYIINEVKKINPSKIIDNLGGHGVAALFNSGTPGPLVILRAELDALPIPEKNDFEYKSIKQGVAHKCGHDGHMTSLLGVASLLDKIDYKGKAVFLFQPAEETAQGAKEVVKEKAIKDLKPDYFFAYHNMPGYPKGSVIIRKGVFASASKGLICRLKGETSHAAHPENGRSPAIAAVNIVTALQSLPQLFAPFNKAALVTIIHVKVGEVAFGTTPGYGEVMATIRSHRNEEMEMMTKKAEKIIANIAAAYDLDFEIEWVEEFPATVNDDECVNIIKEAAEKTGAEIIEINDPFPWSEDFAYYTQEYKGAFFGIGSGENHPQLHNSDYDFPDDILEKAINLWQNILYITSRK